jgi:alkylation response protein AidB-like acyl-CoA dehydrogenase
VTSLDAARALFPRVRALADETEQARRLPRALVDAFASAGLFRLCVPRALGGEEADVGTVIASIEEVARADGSAGWCVMIGATTGLLSGYLPEDVAREVYGADPQVVSGGVLAPRGRAVAADGGYRVTGRWPFASGCQHCAWLVGGCLVDGERTPRRLPNGAPEPVTLVFPAADVEIIDTWRVSGLCGTGSHDMAVREVFVPAARAVWLTTDRAREGGTLYRFPLFGLLAVSIAGVALGIARAAVDELVELAGGKTPTGSQRRLAERAVIQAQVAQAEGALRAGRALLFDAVTDAWSTARARGELGVRDRALLRLAATHATTSAAHAVDLMYNAGGGSSIYATNRLQRCFRDVHAATQHIMVAPVTQEVVGRILLGLETDTSML